MKTDNNDVVENMIEDDTCSDKVCEINKVCIKRLIMVLFIILPFVGFWCGAQYVERNTMDVDIVTEGNVLMDNVEEIMINKPLVECEINTDMEILTDCACPLYTYRKNSRVNLNYEFQDCDESESNVSFEAGKCIKYMEKCVRAIQDYAFLSVSELSELYEGGVYITEGYVADYSDYIDCVDFDCPSGASCAICTPDVRIFENDINNSDYIDMTGFFVNGSITDLIVGEKYKFTVEVSIREGITNKGIEVSHWFKGLGFEKSI